MLKTLTRAPGISGHRSEGPGGAVAVGTMLCWWFSFPAFPTKLRPGKYSGIGQRQAPTGGVGEAPRHEVAGGGAPSVHRALWRLCRSAPLFTIGAGLLREMR